jgi:hypothetical protein
VYPSAAFWLTDYLIASSLQAAYAARTEAEYQQDAGVAGNQPSGSNNNNTQPSQETVTLTPEVKQAIVEEVKAQVAAEQAAANQQGAPSGGGAAFASDAGVPPALDPARRTFVVFSEIDVVADNTECTLTPGDVITRLTDKPNQDQNVTASVTTSKQSDCAPGKQVAVSVTDLQEMQNRFREQLDGGLKELAQKQGSAGLPNAPDTMTVAGDVPPPPVDTTAAKALQDQQAAADQTSTEVKRETSGQGS